MKRIEMELPYNQERVYKGVEFIAKPSKTYDPKKAADKLAEFLEELYNQLPHNLVRELSKDPRIQNFRKTLEYTSQ